MKVRFAWKGGAAAPGLALVAALSAGGAPALELGAPAPQFALAGKDGAIQLARYRGKVVYVDFWASWCGPCRQSFPWMNEMQARHGARGLQVIGVNLDANAADAHRFLAENPAQFPIAFDPAGTTPRAYGIKGMPSSVLVGPDGKVLFEHAGFKAADRADLEKRIEQALGAAK
jgi:cytochrome c biogenesis protein CcmG, thiol:disulfide interchange protein DsbE